MEKEPNDLTHRSAHTSLILQIMNQRKNVTNV